MCGEITVRWKGCICGVLVYRLAERLHVWRLMNKWREGCMGEELMYGWWDGCMGEN
jgi:hypothetical protein